jgi:hypothetical protein
MREGTPAGDHPSDTRFRSSQCATKRPDSLGVPVTGRQGSGNVADLVEATRPIGGRNIKGGVRRWRSYRPPLGLRPGSYLLQLASSTIQLTKSANESPACWASSGTSEVAVMPGWVLTSRQNNSPDPPAVSS